MRERKLQITVNEQTGFSLLELLISMSITLAVMVAASTLLASSLRTRARENTRSDALASAQRALNIMSREIGNSGYGLTDNGIVVLDSQGDSIRVRANLDNDTTLGETDEDIRFVYQSANRAIVRFDNSLGPGGSPVVLATNISGLKVSYLNVAGVATAANSAERVGIEVWVDLPAGLEQPASDVKLTSQVALRNAPNTLQQF
jgi:prepilin-type N-terminal cleavage/methylation domain-containing protein